MIKRFINVLFCLIIIVSIAIPLRTYGQEKTDSILAVNPILVEIAFSQHLIRLKDYHLAISNLKSLVSDTLNDMFKDSIHYLIAKSSFYSKDFDSSVVYFNLISENASFYYESLFYSSISCGYLNDFLNAEYYLSKIKTTDTNLAQLFYLNKAGISLLNRDFKSSDENIQKFNKSWYPVVEQQENVKLLYRDIVDFKQKSPFIAGSLSAIVPGLGKIYAGRLGEGVSAFLITTTMGLVAVENYIKDGWKDPKTIIFGSLFSVFYIGNIWGSTLSVKLINDEFNKEVNEQILFNLRVPLRIIFE